MTAPVVRILETPAALHRAAAEEVVRVLRQAVREGRDPTVALAGGSTPRGLYALLANPAEPFRAQVPWERLQLFWGDERHVPPDHPDSNFRMASEAMLTQVPVPAERIHRIQGELADAAQAAARYEGQLKAVFGPQGAPTFDLVLLGMGPDGHTASLFPGTPVLEERAAWVAAPWVPKFSGHRLTLTYPVLNAARNAIFLVAGPDKATTLRAVLEGPPAPALYPSQAVQPSGALLWLVDRAAAGQLTRQGA